MRTRTHVPVEPHGNAAIDPSRITFFQYPSTLFRFAQLRQSYETGPQEIDGCSTRTLFHRRAGGSTAITNTFCCRAVVCRSAVGTGWSPMDVPDEPRARAGALVAKSVTGASRGGVARRNHRAGRATDHRRSRGQRIHRTCKNWSSEPLQDTRRQTASTSERVAQNDRRTAGSDQWFRGIVSLAGARVRYRCSIQKAETERLNFRSSQSCLAAIVQHLARQVGPAAVY